MAVVEEVAWLAVDEDVAEVEEVAVEEDTDEVRQYAEVKQGEFLSFQNYGICLYVGNLIRECSACRRTGGHIEPEGCFYGGTVRWTLIRMTSKLYMCVLIEGRQECLLPCLKGFVDQFTGRLCVPSKKSNLGTTSRITSFTMTAEKGLSA